MQKINQSFLLASLCAGALLLGSAGCSSNPFARSNDERSTGRVADDKKISKDVKTALKKEPVYKFESVDVQTFAGEVQLSGFVNTDEQKRRAEEIARSQPGVARVINGIALKPEMPQPTGRTGGAEQPHIYAEPNSVPNSSTNNSANPRNP
jgi:hyperosmotically inducible protein